ncbi:TetR/AcrR family transcriptional regulator [Lysinibacillus sp. CNPSo 3705]|uniref:TetR/AcrR family transcriptional regulator n=1 Tax=Lysinibacillus sp. CNPSo 3705 TaxID=3028148 RepID=UPI00104D89D0|nr:TetR/AcrR family transcriptional regulator [Lysinibacillus sp. CNPSo 3705]MDD1505508.1 TetR/AcrR family transcriptional regulator [Lysinibacillus sp. CNPSo 3705]
MSPRKPSTKDLTKEMIINEAHKQFITKDFHQVSMRSIAKELGCSHGAIYYHFKNKAEIFYAIVSDYFSELNNTLDENMNGPEDHYTKLLNVFVGFMAFGLNNQSQYELMFIMRDSEIDGLSQEAANLSYEKFAQAVQSLSRKELLISDIHSTFIALHGFVTHYRHYVKNYEEAKEAVDIHAKFLIKALTHIESSSSKKI